MSQTLDEFDHVVVEVSDGVSLHAVVAGSGPTVVLLHGFPQTWYEWRHLMPVLARDHRVVAVDMKGAGESSKPLVGYDKVTMANDFETLRQELDLGQVQVVGHDIGAMVGYAWAAMHRDSVSRLAFLDAPLPGASLWEGVLLNPRTWHFAFHMHRDMPEFLIAGREYGYVEAFFKDRAVNHAPFTHEEIGYYARALAQPGATRACLEWYRAFPQDVLDNRKLGKEPLSIPVLGLGGAGRWGPQLQSMLSEFASDVRAVSIDRCGHWLVEERFDEVVRALQEFLAHD
ncbi:alpha/beta fold hydrolase [Pseudonocardia lutea]|uniref:Alpha/beta fold hydrolase n=1 Tax=Pseudonocardia lutea TaxID=2172015 RepID=A0ABW1I2L5_9PSEU